MVENRQKLALVDRLVGTSPGDNNVHSSAVLGFSPANTHPHLSHRSHPPYHVTHHTFVLSPSPQLTLHVPHPPSPSTSPSSSHLPCNSLFMYSTLPLPPITLHTFTIPAFHSPSTPLPFLPLPPPTPSYSHHPFNSLSIYPLSHLSLTFPLTLS